MLDFPPPPALDYKNQLAFFFKKEKDLREFNIELPRRTLSIIKRRMMIQFQTRLHTVKLLKLDETKTTALGGFLLVGCDAHRKGLDFGKVLCYGFGGGGEGEIS